MEKVLFINACVRDESRTRMLAQHVLDKIKGEVREVYLPTENIKPLDFEGLKIREEFGKDKDYSHEIFKYAKDFAEADTVVIAAPFWDLSFPATVKTYFEAVTVQGLTFYYTEEGYPAGLCKAKRMIYVTTGGGPIEGFNFGYDYIKTLCQAFYGIEKTYCFKAEMLDVIGSDVEGILNNAIKEIESSDI